MPVTMQVEMKGLAALEKSLRELVPAIRGRKGFAQNPLRTATRKGADIIVEQVKSNARRFDDPETKLKVYEEIGRKPISVKERDVITRAGDSLEGYDIGFKSAAWHGIFQELGTIKQPARPLLRSALEAKRDAALKEFQLSLSRSMEMITKKLERQNRNTK